MACRISTMVSPGLPDTLGLAIQARLGLCLRVRLATSSDLLTARILKHLSTLHMSTYRLSYASPSNALFRAGSTRLLRSRSLELQVLVPHDRIQHVADALNLAVAALHDGREVVGHQLHAAHKVFFVKLAAADRLATTHALGPQPAKRTHQCPPTGLLSTVISAPMSWAPTPAALASSSYARIASGSSVCISASSCCVL
jgi:hypothetical protein